MFPEGNLTEGRIKFIPYFPDDMSVTSLVTSVKKDEKVTSVSKWH